MPCTHDSPSHSGQTPALLQASAAEMALKPIQSLGHRADDADSWAPNRRVDAKQVWSSWKGVRRFAVAPGRFEDALQQSARPPSARPCRRRPRGWTQQQTARLCALAVDRRQPVVFTACSNAPTTLPGSNDPVACPTDVSSHEYGMD